LEKLTKPIDIKRVKNEGITYPHPLVVMIVHPNPSSIVRYCIIAGRKIGKAVKRNRVKRIIKAALSEIHHKYTENNFSTGWDILFIARSSLLRIKTPHLIPIIEDLLTQAKILIKNDD